MIKAVRDETCDCADVLVSGSLSEVVVPSAPKETVVYPLLKKI